MTSGEFGPPAAVVLVSPVTMIVSPPMRTCPTVTPVIVGRGRPSTTSVKPPFAKPVIRRRPSTPLRTTGWPIANPAPLQLPELRVAPDASVATLRLSLARSSATIEIAFPVASIDGPENFRTVPGP